MEKSITIEIVFLLNQVKGMPQPIAAVRSLLYQSFA
jgi:hypothetical protein